MLSDNYLMQFKFGSKSFGIPNPFRGVGRRKSWGELHSFFDTILRGGGNTKSTVKQQLEEYRSWIYIAVSTIYRRMEEIDFRFFRNDNGEEIEPGTPVYNTISSIFRYPNPNMDYRFFKGFMQMQLDLTGMAFAIRQDDSAFGLPLYLWPIPSKSLVKIHYSDKLLNWIDGFEFMIGQKRVMYPANKILYFYYPHPEDPRAPCSPIKSQAYAVDIDHYIEVYERDFFKNSARFDYAIKYPEEIALEEEDIERLKRQWKEKFQGGGAGSYHELAILDQGADVVELSPKNEDLALMSLAQWSQDKVLAAYTVPAGKVGLVKDVNKANAVGIDITFNSECIMPRLKLHDAVVNRMVLSQFDSRIELRHNNPVPRDRELDIEEIKTKVGTPIWSVNEGRKRDNLPPVEGGDVVYVPLNMMPLSATVPSLPEEEPIEDDDEEGEVEEALIIEDEKLIEFKEYTEEHLDRRWYKFKQYTEAWESMLMNKMASLFEAQKEEVIQNLEKEYDNTRSLKDKHNQIRQSFKKKWNIFLSKYNGWSTNKVVEDIERNPEMVRDLIIYPDNKVLAVAVEGIIKGWRVFAVLDKLKDVFTTIEKAKLGSIVFDWDNNLKTFDRLGRQVHESILLETGEEELTSLGIDSGFQITNEYAKQYLGEKVRDFSQNVLSTKYNQLKRTLRTGFGKGENLNQLSSRVAKVYRGVLGRGYEALRIARTEVVSSSNKGAMLAYQQSGVVVERQWLSARDDRTRGADTEDPADHFHMNGQRVTMSKPFVDPKTGARMMHPGDSSMGASGVDIVNCRCTMVPHTTSTARGRRGVNYPQLIRMKRGNPSFNGVNTARMERSINDCSLLRNSLSSYERKVYDELEDEPYDYGEWKDQYNNKEAEDKLEKDFGFFVIRGSGYNKAVSSDTYRYARDLNIIGREAGLLKKYPEVKRIVKDDPVEILRIANGKSVDAYGEVAKTGNTVGWYDSSRNTIALATDQKTIREEVKTGGFVVGKDLQTSIRHEIGHHVHEMQDSKTSEAFRVIAKSKDDKYWEEKVSKYGSSNSDELFAESFAAYTSPSYGTLGDRLPKEIEDFMEEILYGKGK